MSQPLNPRLYQALKDRFGKVKISNQGQQAVVQISVDPYTKKPRNTTLLSGEQYQICCPFCQTGDNRFRLYISYRWRVVEQGRVTGQGLTWCFNESRNESRKLEDALRFYAHSKTALPPRIVFQEPEVKSVQLPGVCVPLTQLPANHPAILYLMNGRKNPLGQSVAWYPGELYEEWGIRYCISAMSGGGYAPELVQNRLILPIFWEQQLVGWQARAIDNSLPKYYTMPGLNKGRLLFNGDRAREQSGLVIVVEGIFDAMAVGPEHGVAVLGSSVNHFQRTWLARNFGTGTLVLLFDSDRAGANCTKVNMALMQGAFSKGCFAVSLPQGWDAGSMSRENLWQVIRSEGRRFGVEV